MVSNGFHPLTLVSKTREYDEVFTLTFRPGSPIPYAPGQYVHLLAPHSPPGRENVRHLSIASVPGDGDLAFTVDLAPTSEYKAKLAALELGGKAHLFKVKGEFVLGDPPPSKVVFLAGGLGITPVRALVRQIAFGRLPVDWGLVHVARGRHLYADDLGGLGGTQVRVDRRGAAAAVSGAAARFPGARWYVSGSHRFVEGMRLLLDEAGVAQENRRFEDFS